jgi:tetratricopeptide (TPR) repeat protein
VLSGKSDILRQQHRLDEALAVADLAVAANPTLADSHFVRGRVLVEKGMLEKAESAFSEVLRLNPRAVPAQLELAHLHLRRGASDSIALATRATQTAPQNLDARLTLARAQRQQHQYDQAQSTLEGLLGSVPRAAIVHAELGSLLLTKNNSSGARQAFNRALERDAFQLQAIEGLTALDLKMQRRSEAFARLDALLARASTNTGILMIAAKAYTFSHDLDRAEQVLVKAIEIDPGLMTAYSMLGHVYLAQRRLDTARAQFAKMAGAQENPVGALTLVGMIDLMQQRFSDAQRTFERVLQLDPRAAVAANNLAWIYAEHGGSLDIALQLAEIATGALPNQPEAHDTLGWIFYKKDLLAPAIRALKQSVELDPSNATASYHLALAYQKSGDNNEARRTFEAFLKLDSSPEQTADLKRRFEALGGGTAKTGTPVG